MRRLAAVFTFSLLAGTSMPALADVGPEPPPKPEETSNDEDGCSLSNDAGILGLAALALLISGVALRRRRTAALAGFLLLTGVSTSALADEPPERPKKKSGGKKNCSVNDEDNAIVGLAALALLISGVALRKRQSPMPRR